MFRGKEKVHRDCTLGISPVETKRDEQCRSRHLRSKQEGQRGVDTIAISGREEGGGEGGLKELCSSGQRSKRVENALQLSPARVKEKTVQLPLLVARWKEKGGATEPSGQEMTQLPHWSRIDGEANRACSSTARVRYNSGQRGSKKKIVLCLLAGVNRRRSKQRRTQVGWGKKFLAHRCFKTKEGRGKEEKNSLKEF